MATHETCERCSGSGRIDCPVCRGAGSVKRPGAFELDTRTCESCHGTGKARCHACDGSGTVKLDD